MDISEMLTRFRPKGIAHLGTMGDTPGASFAVDHFYSHMREIIIAHPPKTRPTGPALDFLRPLSLFPLRFYF